MRRVQDERGVIVIAVVFTGVILSLVVTGLLATVAHEMQMLQLQKDFVRARYAADGGVAVVLTLLAEGRDEEITASPQSIPVGRETVTVRPVSAVGAETLEYEARGRAGRALVTVRLVVDRQPPHQIRVWAVAP